MGAAERAKSLEQQVRDILSAAMIEDAQEFTAGDLLEAANILGEQNRQAEQVAREKALEEAACFVEEQAKIWWRSHNDNSTDMWLAIDDVAKALRALKDKP